MADEKSNMGRFLGFETWSEALMLLNYQIARKQKNKHFNTLSMYYYKGLGAAVEDLDEKEYFNERVASNLFYGLEKEYAIYPYVIPKPGLGLRNYKFLTYPLRTLYYSVGLYLLKLSFEFLKDYYYKQKNIKSNYGGRLWYSEGKLVLNSRNTYFQFFYKQFKSHMRRQTKGDIENRVVIRIDIQNYYDTISVPMLLEHITDNCKASIQKSMNFDDSTKDQIVSFFRYLMVGRDGILQADNDIVSSFVGYLYLVFADLEIEELLQAESCLSDYKIIRYSDDIAISITFNKNVMQARREEVVESLASRIADLLFYDFQLKLNTKTRLFWLNDPEALEDFNKSLKKVSPNYHIADDSEEDPSAKIENIFNELENLKKSAIRIDFTHQLQEEILKEVYDQRVQQLLKKQSNLDRIHDIFDGFNFGLIRVYPLPIMIVLLHDAQAKSNFVSFLTSKTQMTTSDIDLIFTYLCQTGFNDKALLDKLAGCDSMIDIVEKYRQSNLELDYPGYYVLCSAKTISLGGKAYVMDQVRLRVINERIGTYSVALNHLLNEIHAICFELDSANSNKQKSYDANDVANFLQSQRVPNQTRIAIRNLFDRRNTNQVSHPGSEQSVSWGVSSSEYYAFKQQVGMALDAIL